MKIRLYNSLSRRVEDFEPLTPGRVLMYSCGPTVYDFAHIGNFRSFLAADLLRRFLELEGLEVIHGMNITDVGHMTEDDGSGEDKMMVAARRIQEDKKSGKVPEGTVDDPNDPYQIADYYTKAFLEDATTLALKVAGEYPERMFHATGHIQEMQELIQKLLDRGHAYVSDEGVVYFSVESFRRYGELSGNTVDQLRAGQGGRVSEQDLADKRAPEDFLLWKPDPSHIMKWDSPWGEGYPGWHVECSAMAMKRLGSDVIDIHTGGEDLIFPHHECEVAQSCGATGEDHFARFWIHTRFLLVEGKKMSKSLGNFYTARDVLEGRVTGRPVHPSVLRYELIKTHHRTNLNFTVKGLGDSAQAVSRLEASVNRAREASGGQKAEVGNDHPVIAQFLEALRDDVNISAALAVVLPWASQNSGEDPGESLAVLEKIDGVLGVLDLAEHGVRAPQESAGSGDLDVEALCRELDQARADRDFARSDALRDQLVDAGYDVQTGPDGTTARKKLA